MPSWCIPSALAWSCALLVPSFSQALPCLLSGVPQGTNTCAVYPLGTTTLSVNEPLTDSNASVAVLFCAPVACIVAALAVLCPPKPNAPKAVIALMPKPPFNTFLLERFASRTSSKGLLLLLLKRVLSNVSLLIATASYWLTLLFVVCHSHIY